jgi:hypothetical protein
MVAVIVGVDFLFFRTRFWGAADGECWDCSGFRSFLLEISQPVIGSATHKRFFGALTFKFPDSTESGINCAGEGQRETRDPQ